MLQFNEGDIIAGKYRVERAIGRGGMGIVLAARHTQLEERVAIKLMLPEAAAQPEAVARFLREARAAAKLESIHVARVTDVGTLDSGEAYMVMEYLDGSDLSQILKSQGPVSVSDAVDYVLQASAAIAEAHSIGIVHRDLKPSNLFLTRRRDRTPLIKVLDFGISKVSEGSPFAHDSAVTQSTSLMGSPLYMSPEQMMSMRDVDGRADIWALGIILYELLAGTTPFCAETLPKVCAAVMSSEPEALASKCLGVPPELEACVMRCLAKHPADRFQTIADLAKALVPFSGAFGRTAVEGILRLSEQEPMQPMQAPTPVVTLGAHLNAAGSISSTHAAWSEPVSRQPVARGARASFLAAGTLLLLAVGGGLTGWMLRSKTDPATPAAASAVAAAKSATLVTQHEAKSAEQIVVRLQPMQPEPPREPEAESEPEPKTQPLPTSPAPVPATPRVSTQRPATANTSQTTLRSQPQQPQSPQVSQKPTPQKPKLPSMGGRL